MPIQYAEGTVSWNGFLKQVGFGDTQVYEVSGVSVIPEEGPGGGGGTDGTPVQLRCLDGDWLIDDNNDPQKTVILSTGDLSPEDIEGFFSDIVIRGNLIHESETAIRDEFTKTIGFDGFAQSNNQNLPFDIPVTITILCHSPSSLMTVGGEWVATDTTALIIGYSVLNAYWLAPIGIGIGVGVYLVKRKF